MSNAKAMPGLVTSYPPGTQLESICPECLTVAGELLEKQWCNNCLIVRGDWITVVWRRRRNTYDPNRREKLSRLDRPEGDHTGTQHDGQVATNHVVAGDRSPSDRSVSTRVEVNPAREHGESAGTVGQPLSATPQTDKIRHFQPVEAAGPFETCRTCGDLVNPKFHCCPYASRGETSVMRKRRLAAEHRDGSVRRLLNAIFHRHQST